MKRKRLTIDQTEKLHEALFHQAKADALRLAAGRIIESFSWDPETTTHVAIDLLTESHVERKRGDGIELQLRGGFRHRGIGRRKK